MLALFLVGTASNAADKIEGWKDTKWGMTEAEVLSAISESNKVTRDLDKYMKGAQYSSIQIPKIKIGAYFYKASFLFDSKTKDLCRVILSCVEGQPQELAYQQVQELLTKKYGAHTYTNTNREGGWNAFVEKKTIWKLSGTNIEMDYTYIEDVTERFNIAYVSSNTTESNTENL